MFCSPQCFPLIFSMYQMRIFIVFTAKTSLKWSYWSLKLLFSYECLCSYEPTHCDWEKNESGTHFIRQYFVLKRLNCWVIVYMYVYCVVFVHASILWDNYKKFKKMYVVTAFLLCPAHRAFQNYRTAVIVLWNICNTF